MSKAASTLSGLDRVLTTRVVWPAIRKRAMNGSGAIPVLMYHSVSRELDVQRAPYYRTVTSPEVFARHLQWLRSAGFVTVTLSQAADMLRGDHAGSPGRLPVVITFDDGFEDFYSNAFPLLQAEGMTATVFLSTHYIGGTFPTGLACLSVRQVKELSSQGVEFGSHSVTHARLVEQTTERLEQELAESKATIEDILGEEVPLFSFPYRFPSEEANFVNYLQERLLANGYRAGVTTTVGRATKNSNSLFLPRLPINDCDDDELFRAKLFGGYDWFGTVQHVYKAWKAKLPKARSWQKDGRSIG